MSLLAKTASIFCLLPTLGPRGHVFFTTRESRRPYMERKYVDPWNTQFKNIQILYILKRPLEKVGWTALKQRGIEWDESTFLREAFEKLTAWTQNQVERDFLKRRSLLGLEYVLNVIWLVPRHVICASWQESRTWNTHSPTRDQIDQIFWDMDKHQITIYPFLNLHPYSRHITAIKDESKKSP